MTTTIRTRICFPPSWLFVHFPMRVPPMRSLPAGSTTGWFVSFRILWGRHTGGARGACLGVPLVYYDGYGGNCSFGEHQRAPNGACIRTSADVYFSFQTLFTFNLLLWGCSVSGIGTQRHPRVRCLLSRDLVEFFVLYLSCPLNNMSNRSNAKTPNSEAEGMQFRQFDGLESEAAHLCRWS